MKTSLRLRSLACAAFLLAAALPAVSAADGPAPAPAPAKRPAISIDFPGGSLSKFVAALPKTDGASISIIGETAEMATELPAFSLRNAEPLAVVQSLGSLLNARDISISVTGASPDGVVATINRKGPGPKKVVPSTPFESFQLAPFLGTQTVDDIVAAIRLAWELDPSHDKDAIRIKFHPPTSILLVSGPGPAIDTAKAVIGSLRRAPDAPNLAEVLAKRLQEEESRRPAPAPAKK